MKSEKPLAYVQIDRKALAHNVRVLTQKAKPGELLFVIKADAYGHGVYETAEVLNRLGVRWFAVSDLEEGIQLRKKGFKQKILLLEHPLFHQIKDIIRYNITPTVSSLELAKLFNKNAKKKFNVHIKIDTGMGRFGIRENEALGLIRNIHKLPNITIEGLYSHFSSADMDRKYTLNQLSAFNAIIATLKKEDISFPYIHIANSMGFVRYKSTGNLSRLGLLLYGLYPSDHLRSILALKPVMRIFATVVFVKDLERGESVSYARAFKAKQKMKTAIVSIGYKDGYLRSLSNCSYVLINQKRCAVLGRVTMDQIIVDISKAGRVRIGTPVVILGSSGGANISAEDLARWAKTNNYEIVCSFGHRMKRLFSF